MFHKLHETSEKFHMCFVKHFRGNLSWVSPYESPLIPGSWRKLCMISDINVNFILCDSPTPSSCLKMSQKGAIYYSKRQLMLLLKIRHRLHSSFHVHLRFPHFSRKRQPRIWGLQYKMQKIKGANADFGSKWERMSQFDPITSHFILFAPTFPPICINPLIIQLKNIPLFYFSISQHLSCQMAPESWDKESLINISLISLIFNWTSRRINLGIYEKPKRSILINFPKWYFQWISSIKHFIQKYAHNLSYAVLKLIEKYLQTNFIICQQDKKKATTNNHKFIHPSLQVSWGLYYMEI